MSESSQRFYHVLNYTFKDRSLLEQALTHRSAAGKNNERLEFLGDALLGSIVAEALYQRFTDANEGQLTRLRASLVSREALARMAEDLELGECLRLGEGERRSGGGRRLSILANALEAVIGAVYEDAGFKVARSVVLSLFEPTLGSLSLATVKKDPKTQLQELLQARRFPVPAYEVTSTEGEPHERWFTVRCVGHGIPDTIEGQGASRREAEQTAASKALEMLCTTAANLTQAEKMSHKKRFRPCH
ncbi:MAG: ribonuclease III [Gammaproteobacteria bacterium]